VFVALKGPRRGQPLSAAGLDEVLDGARRRAGLTHASCHELRHTCLTRLREAGMALEAVQAQAGHDGYVRSPPRLRTNQDLARFAVGQVPGSRRDVLVGQEDGSGRSLSFCRCYVHVANCASRDAPQ
jgi:hypothetical protein